MSYLQTHTRHSFTIRLMAKSVFLFGQINIKLVKPVIFLFKYELYLRHRSRISDICNFFNFSGNNYIGLSQNFHFYQKNDLFW